MSEGRLHTSSETLLVSGEDTPGGRCRPKAFRKLQNQCCTTARSAARCGFALLRGALIVTFYLLAAPRVIAAGFPPMLAMLLAILLPSAQQGRMYLLRCSVYTCF